MAQKEDQFKKVLSHAKEYGYIFQSSEIYDGLSAVYDYAQNGVELKKNIRDYWWKSMVQMHQNIVGLDASILMHPTTWKASGHVDAFNDPLIDNKDSKKRYRADVLIEDYCAKIEGKINKEVAKASKRFGDAFNKEEFLSTNGRVLGYQEKIKTILSRMGASLDWDSERFTLDEGLSVAVNKVFIDLYEEGLIYKGKRLVNWDPVLQTALSDLEVISSEENGKIWQIKYFLDDRRLHH